MTPDQHAVKAEDLLEDVEDFLDLLKAENKEPTDSEILSVTLTAARAQVHATLSLRPPSPEPGFVPRHETLSGADLALPADDPNADGDYSPGS